MRTELKLASLLAAVLAAGCGSKSGESTGVCGASVDIQSDAQNCGACGHACTSPAHATAICLQGACSRGPCAQGWTTLDPAASDCETPCPGGQCVGETVVIPLTGAVFEAFASGSSYGDKEQSSGLYTNTAVMGESTPPGDGFVTETSAKYTNVSGLNAALH